MLKKFLCYLALVLVALTSNAQTCFAEPEPEQAPLTAFALQVAKDDGHKHPQLLVGIIKVESDAGASSSYRVVKQGLSTFYGAAQLTIGAAKDVMKRFPDLWNGFNTRTDEELKARLILDDKFNVRIASKYLLLMGVNLNPDKGVAAYNVGLGGVELVNYKEHSYTLKVKRAAKR